MGLNINSIILILFAAGFIGAIVYIRLRIWRISKSLFGTSSLAEGLKKAKQEAESAPKSLSGMTRLLLPRIQEDFPAFNWEEYRQKVRTDVRSCIADKHDKPQEIELHETEISDYRNSEGTCYIRCQTSAGYRTDAGNWIEKKYETDLVYIQDVSKLPPTQTGIGLNCPNCGAPIQTLGVKICPFCGTGITELNIRVWKVTGTRELGK